VKPARWLKVSRASFLPLSVILAFLGTSIAWFEGAFHLGHALLAGFGLVLAHVSVNAFNEYFDFLSGVDLKTEKTPFSGGSGALPGGLVSPRQAFWLALGSLVAIVPIGIYFCIVRGWLLLPLILAAGAIVVLYTPVILKIGWPEWAPGVGLGILPVLGMYFVQTGAYTLPALIAAVPSGILVHNLLFLNEFPDVEADRSVGRKTLPIVIGKARAAIVYSVMTIGVYVWIIGAVVVGVMPVFALIALLTVPLAFSAIRGAVGYADPGRLMQGMASNVPVVLLTQLLLGAGYLLAGAF
jgi:1,4-dihydroxy-2-naphthoate octaprenyltransferase